MKRFLFPKKLKEEVDLILHLPFIERVLHPKGIRAIAAVFIGSAIMSGGAAMASHAHDIAHMLPVHYLFFDIFGLFLHGVGAVPALRYIEPFWNILFGGVASEAAVEVIEEIEEQNN